LDLETGDGPIASWETLKKKARRVETALFSKLGRLSKLAVKLDRQANGLGGAAGGESKKPKAAGDSSGDDSGSDSHVSLEKEIDALIAQLNATSEEMSRYAGDAASVAGAGVSGAASGSGESTSFIYLAQRYRAVASEFAVEFKRTRESIAASVARTELLGDTRSGGLGGGLRPRAELLLGERTSLHASLRTVDNVLGEAEHARSRLQYATAVFASMRTRVSGIGKKFPVVNSLINRIQASKNREQIWLALTCAVCMIFTFLWWSSR